jgi:hypothetical protein
MEDCSRTKTEVVSSYCTTDSRAVLVVWYRRYKNCNYGGNAQAVQFEYLNVGEAASWNVSDKINKNSSGEQICPDAKCLSEKICGSYIGTSEAQSKIKAFEGNIPPTQTSIKVVDDCKVDNEKYWINIDNGFVNATYNSDGSCNGRLYSPKASYKLHLGCSVVDALGNKIMGAVYYNNDNQAYCPDNALDCCGTDKYF